MASRSLSALLASVAILASCDTTYDADRRVPPKGVAKESSDPNIEVNKNANLTVLPNVHGPDGVIYPYFEYESSSLVGNDAVAVFVYPIFDRRNKGLALPHLKGENVRDLFESEELFGRQFSVVSKGSVLLIDELPVSRPVEMKADSRWTMAYVGSKYDCKVVSKTGIDFLINCASKNAELKLSFNEKRGFTSYQDFCQDRLCDYSLNSEVGLLSPYHVGTLSTESNRRFKVATESSSDGGTAAERIKKPSQSWPQAEGDERSPPLR